MTEQHTPGPWTIYKTQTGALSINKTSKVPIAMVGGSSWHLGQAIAGANARLIAAAPDLLALAERIAPQEPMWFPGNPQLEALINGWIMTARAAITKAKGEGT